MEVSASTVGSAEHDPITQQVLQNALRAIAQEMLLSMMRTARSAVIREGGDCSTALFDAAGRTIAQGVALAVHLGAMPDALDALREKFEGDVYPGDVFILNDPDEGGMHLPDMFVFQPAFAGTRLIGWAGTVAHQKDVGGRVPGSIAVDSTDIFQEGLQVPGIKFYSRGEENRSFVDILRKNIRFPDETMGDLHSLVAACHSGCAAFAELAERYGIETLQSYVDHILDSTERLVRAGISEIPDGSYEFSDYIDDDGLGSGPITIKVRLVVDGDAVRADFDGTSPQVTAALNATVSVAKAAVYAAVQCCIDVPDILDNSGASRAISIDVPLGTILNPRRPASRGSRGMTLFRMFDAVMGAMHHAVPGIVPAAGCDVDLLVFVGQDDGEEIEMLIDTVTGGWGGGPLGDGLEGVSGIFANLANQPIEVLESISSMRVERYGFVADTGGPGRHRGAQAITRAYRFLLDTGFVQVRSDRRILGGAYGLAGGSAGVSGTSIVNPGPDEVRLPGIARQALRRGDVLAHVTTGGGGFGEPLERDPELVLEDVLDGKISVAHARDAYGVDVDAANGVAIRVRFPSPAP